MPPVADAMRVRVPVGSPETSQGSVCGPIAVFDPVPRLTRVPIAAIDDEVRLGPDRSAEANEFVGSEGVSLGRAPGQVLPNRPVALWADPIAPAVARGEIAAWVPDQRRCQALDRRPDVRPKTVLVGEWRLRVVDPAIDASAEVLDETPEDVRVDVAEGALRVDLDAIHHAMLPRSGQARLSAFPR